MIIVSHNDGPWLRACLATVFDSADGARLDVVVVDSGSTDDTRALVADEFPQARTIACANHGFAHANNRALMTCDARYVLFLNPDTEIVAGTFGELLRALDARPAVGLIGVRQLDGEGTLHPTIRRFPNALRTLGEALGSERLPVHSRWLGERVLDPGPYERETPCDWTTGSFMLARREAIESAGFLDERFFMYSEEVDLCRRVRSAGWEIRHLPLMTIVHHAGKAGVDPRIEALNAYTRVVYARKHFSPPHRFAHWLALTLRHGLRAVYAGRGESARQRRAASRHVAAALTGRAPVPNGSPTPRAVRPAAPDRRVERADRRVGA